MLTRPRVEVRSDHNMAVVTLMQKVNRKRCVMNKTSRERLSASGECDNSRSINIITEGDEKYNHFWHNNKIKQTMRQIQDL